MTAANVFYATALFVLLPHHGFALDILAIVSLPLHSHYMAFSTLFRELAVRGHHVTVINNFHDQHAPPNLRFVDIQFERFNGTPTLEFYEQLDRNYVHYYNMYRHISLGQRNVRLDCGHLFNSANVKAHLAEGRKYDVIFVEQFMSDCALAYALALYDAPIIGISSHVMLPFAYPRLGIPFDVAADQFYFSKAGPNPSLFEKLETFLFLKFITGIGRWALHRHIYAAFDHHLPNHSLDIERDAKARMKMMFSYQHHSVCGARLLAPQLLEIGGVHIGVPKTVPKDILECRDSMEMLNELNEKGRAKLTQLREELENFELYGKDIGDQKYALTLESERHQLACLLREFKQANIISMFAIEKAQRQELMKPTDGQDLDLRNRKKKVDRDGMIKMSSGVTEQLLAISRQLADTTQRSQDTLDSLVSSSSTVHGTQSELQNTAGTITQSSKLLKKYGRREFTDKVIMFFAFLFFLAVCLYIFQKRMF